MGTKLFCGILVLGALTGCTSDEEKKKAALLEEAARFHQEATDIQEKLEPEIDRIDSLKTVLMMQITPRAQQQVATLDSLKTAFETWESNLVEVPGMEHEHHHDHGKHEHHHHTDATLKDLPADQMRDLQREVLANIKAMQTRMNQVLAAD